MSKSSRSSKRRAHSRSSAGGLTPLIVLLFAAIVIAGYLVQKYLFPNGVTAHSTNDTVPESPVRITEVMSSNASVLSDDNGQYSDWFEVTNVSSEPVNLYNWKVSKNAALLSKFFEFPNHTLAPGESALVFCTSTLQNNYGYAYHAPFKVSAAGDTLVLYDASDAVRQTLEVPELPANASYAEKDGVWASTFEPTPGMSNASEGGATIRISRRVVESAVTITELMAKNASFLPDDDGNVYDWVEIHNSSDRSVNLNGYALSDSETNLQKWRFPDISIGPNGYLLVYCSGNDRRDPNRDLHAGFRLSGDGETLILTNASGQTVSYVEYGVLASDQSYSVREDGVWTTLLSPTPGFSNDFSGASEIDRMLTSQNSSGVFINEIMASASAGTSTDANASCDWVELYNSTSQPVNLSGWGLSDNSSAPRKWQFPEGTVIPAGSYIGIYLSGLNTQKGGYYHTNFCLSSTEGEILVLSGPDGTIYDRAVLGAQYSNQSYGRINGKDGFYYLSGATPGTANVTTGYESRMLAPEFSMPGGMYDAGSRLSLTLSAEPGATIYYTLDCSTPDPAAVGGATYTLDPMVKDRTNRYQTYVYTSPIMIDSTTVVRAVSAKNGQLSSYVETQTYFVGVSHTMNTLSLVLDPADLWDYRKGLYVFGPNAKQDYPYGSINSGANFWMTWEKDANVEIFSADKTPIISQGCGMRLHGQYSRAEDQKAFKVIARSKYGVSRFYANLFPNRDYTEYQSFVLRPSGEDTDKTRMRDSVLTALTAGSSVMYQDTKLCVVYLNGEYWGHYNMRERINSYSICQWEGWDVSLKDNVDLVKANTATMQGSVDTWNEIKSWYAKNGIDTAEKLAYVEQYIDVENYLQYVAVQMYTGNTDLLNCKKYRSSDYDGKWRWVLFDLDWAFYTDTNSVGRWLTKGGVGSGNKTDNSLFIALMKNPECKDYFLRYFAEHLRTNWSSEAVIAVIKERYDLLEPEIDQTLERWGISRSKYESEINSFVNYAKKRPGRLLYFFSKELTKAEMNTYFGDILETVPMLDK